MQVSLLILSNLKLTMSKLDSALFIDLSVQPK